MSLPQFPTISPALTREDALNQIISSIAMEELGLSHIINAEGEKLQYVLGTIPGVSGPSATIEDVLKVNESVRSVLQSAAETQTVLRAKLQNALSASVMKGPTGPKGDKGDKGEDGAGAIIPYSSGIPMSLPTDVDGETINPVLISVGDNIAAEFDGDNIDLTGNPDKAANFTVIVPRDGTVSSLIANFYTDKAPELGNAIGTVTARLYQSDPNNAYLFVRIASVALSPTITSTTPVGTLLTGSANNIDVAVTPGTKLLLAFEAHATGPAAAADITGYGSASLAIS